MVAAEVSHDILAALIAGLAVVLVPIIGFSIVAWRQNRANRTHERRVDMVALREQVNEVLTEAREMQRIFGQAHERRAAEHERILGRLEDIASMIATLRKEVP